MPPSQRKKLGAWYTPPALVAQVVEHALGAWMARASARGRAVRVLDPACGDGRFLAAAAAAISAAGLESDLTGIDVDPGALEAARRSLPAADLRQADALAADVPAQFDLVVGNPPFLNQLAAATTRGGSSRFGGGPYADAAAEFLALAVRAVAAGGVVGLVLPQSMLASRDVAPIRADIDARAALRWMWWSPTAMFDANVRTWAGVWEVGGRPGPVRRAFGPGFDAVAEVRPASWVGLLSDAAAPPAGERTLGSIAVFRSDFRQHYYGLVGNVGDDRTGPPLVTSGLIEPGRCLWGVRPARFAKRRFSCPRVDVAALSPPMQAWAEARLVPKILVANQTARIEAVRDDDGAWLPCVPVITCTAADLDTAERVLASDRATEWVRYHGAGSGLSAGAVRLTPALLASIPLDG